MKMKKVKLAIALIISLSAVLCVVRADSWAAIASGYAITTDCQGQEIPPGTLVTATAGTTEYPGTRPPNNRPDVTGVRFRWMPPADSGLEEIFSPTLGSPPRPFTWDGSTTYGGVPVYTATDAQIVNAVGDWGVQAWFYDAEGNLAMQSGVEVIRATSVHVIPEVPLGTLTATLAMFAALALSWVRINRKAVPVTIAS